MKIKKTITLNLTKYRSDFICSDVATLNMILGTTAVSGNYHLYNIRKQKNKFLVPIKVVKQRVEELEERKDKIEAKLEIMKQVLI